MKLTKVYFMQWVSNMDRACSFYRSVFGLSEVYRSAEWSELRFGDSTLALHAGAAGPADRHSGLGFEVDDVATACGMVREAGGRVVAGPLERPDEGIRVADCADTEGNRFTVAQPIR